MADDTTGPLWDALRAAGISVEHAADGWTYTVRFPGGSELDGNGHATAVEAAQAAIILVMSYAGRVA